MQSIKELQEICNYICKSLEIPPPKIIIGKIESDSKTALYGSFLKENVILITDIEQSKLDSIYAIAHECRHFYQHKKVKDGEAPEWEENFKNYFNSTNENIEEYNSQLVEIDAHAWASNFMESELGISPLFKGFSESLKNKIKKEALKLKGVIS